MDLLILLPVAIPWTAALLILASPRGIWAEIWTHLAAAGTLAAVARCFAAFSAGGPVEAAWGEIVPGVAIAFRADALGLAFAGLSSGLWVLTSVYSSGYVRATDLAHRRRYFACFALAVGSALGVALAANLLTFLLFYEALTLSTWPLVLHKETPEALRAGRKYLAYALSAGATLTVAVAATSLLAGTLDFRSGGIFTSGTSPSPARLGLLFALFAVAFAVKSAVMPLHAWLPAAMVAPTPVSGLLHAVAVVKAGVFAYLRIGGWVFGPEALAVVGLAPWLAAGCAATILLASFAAVNEDHLKRRLAYSTIAHLSYIVLGSALVHPAASVGSLLHMLNHGLAKITLFFCAGAIYSTAHIEKVSGLSGLGRRMPWTFAAFTVAALGLMGVPGLCGFAGKLFLCKGAIETGRFVHLAVLLGGTVLGAAYLLPIVRIAYFDPPPSPPSEGAAHKPPGETPWLMRAPLLATAAAVVFFGMVPRGIDLQYKLAIGAATAVFGSAP